MKFDQLISVLNETHAVLACQAGKSVNYFLTIRNWLIGYRIFEYEQRGEDRAQYGDNLIPSIVESLQKNYSTWGFSKTALKDYRKFYLVYPEISQTVSDQFESLKNQIDSKNRIGQTLSGLFDFNDQISGAVPRVPIDKLLKNVPFSAFVEFIRIDDPLKRSFYEIECLRGQWSTRELHRQINTLYYERSAYSTDKQKLAALVCTKKPNHCRQVASCKILMYLSFLVLSREMLYLDYQVF